MNAPIRLLFLLSLLLPACAAGTRPGVSVPRPIRESMVLADHGAFGGASSVPVREMRARQPERASASRRPTAVR